MRPVGGDDVGGYFNPPLQSVWGRAEGQYFLMIYFVGCNKYITFAE